MSSNATLSIVNNVAAFQFLQDARSQVLLNKDREIMEEEVMSKVEVLVVKVAPLTVAKLKDFLATLKMLHLFLESFLWQSSEMVKIIEIRLKAEVSLTGMLTVNRWTQRPYSCLSFEID